MSSNNSSTQNEQAKKVVEDGPKMRSVAMLSPSAMPLMPRMTPLVKESSPSYSMPAKAAPSPVINTKSIQQFYSHVQSFPSMPHAYFLERTHVAIAHATPNEIAQRVATCLQKQSVAATYHNHEACFEAESQDCVHFVVRFWEKSPQVIVEVQRSGGCSYAFHQLARAVLLASQGKAVTPAVVPPIPQIPAFATDDNAADIQMEYMREGLEIAIDLFEKNDAYDTQLMAMESLAHLTKTCRFHGLAAQTVFNTKKLWDVILSLVECPVRGNSGEMSQMEESHLTLMRRQALIVLANCLESLKDQQLLNRYLEEYNVLQADGFLESLIREIGNADARPHEACHACRALRCVCDASSPIRQRVVALNATAVLVKAQEQGHVRHAQLEQMSSKLHLVLLASCGSETM